MKKKSILLTLLALVMVLTASLGTAWAYFTTYAVAEGGYTIHLGDKTQIHEEFSEWTKHVTITSDEESQPVYIRAKAFCGSQYDLTISGEGWTKGEGDYWYYGDVVNGGGSTTPLDVKIENVPAGKEFTDELEMNVIVVYESTPVRYDEDGKPYADWNVKLDTGKSKGGA